MSSQPAPMRTLNATAFLFDMDGVLIDSRPAVERVWRRWAQRHRRSGDEVVSVAHGRRTVETIAIVAPDLDVDVEVAWLDAEELVDSTGVTAIFGAAAFVASLPRHCWAVVTSATEALARLRLGLCGIPIPDVLITSESVRHGKPSPEGYLAAADRLGVAPDGCVVFEDAPPGVEAAQRAGMRVVALPTTHDPMLLDADAVIRDFTHVSVVHSDGALRLALGP